MKLTGKEKVSLYTEKDGKRNFTISQLNLDQLINDFILDRMCQQLIKNKNTLISRAIISNIVCNA